MKVAWVLRYGPPEVVSIQERPAPEAGPGEIRIRVLATTVSTGDWRVRSGELPRGFGWLRGPVLGFGGPRKGVLGTEAAGVVDAVGAGVTSFAVGDSVMAFPGSAMGAHAEHLVMPADGRVAALPANLSFEEAAALPFGAMTARDFLVRGEVRAGERVLVNGASGGVGVAAVQLAKALGAHVTAVCSARNAELVRSLGADEVVDHATTDFAATGARWDVILDTVGNASYARIRDCLFPGGRLLCVLADLWANLEAPFVGRRRGHRIVAGPAKERPEDLRAVAALAASGALRPVIEARYPFERIGEAHALVETGRKRGAVVVTLDAAAASAS